MWLHREKPIILLTFYSIIEWLWFVVFFFNSRTVALKNEEENDENGKKNAAETSNEILDDVLRQLDKLSTDKRKQILNKLAVSNLIADSDIKNLDKITSTTPKSKVTSAKQSREAESIQDEVEILDLHEPKLGTYKRKRSK